jgi:hypothetical protein
LKIGTESDAWNVMGSRVKSNGYFAFALRIRAASVSVNAKFDVHAPAMLGSPVATRSESVPRQLESPRAASRRS